MPETAPAPVADLVLEGGGVKGLALAGALQPFGDAGYSIARVGGSSAGALVGAVLAALQQRGEPISRLEDVARTLDYRRFPDRGFVGRHLGPLAFLADAVSVLAHDGAYRGRYLERWLGGVLADLGVSTFGDLRTDDPGDDGTIHHRYRLAVTATDLSRRRLVYLPWQYEEFGRDPDEQRVVDAVRASASIPFFFRPVTLTGPRGSSTTLVDGGLVSNYPVSMFDRADGEAPRWPTLGIRLGAFDTADPGPAERVRGAVPLGVALVETAIEACQTEHVLLPCNVSRSVSVDTSAIGATDFDLTAAQREQLIHDGRSAARSFLATWDFESWLATCGPATTRRTPGLPG